MREFITPRTLEKLPKYCKTKKAVAKKKKKAMVSKQIGKHSLGRKIDRYFKSSYILFIRKTLMQNDKKK